MTHIDRLNPIPGPDDITRRELPNGIVVLARENFTAQSVVVAGSLPAGALLEPPESAGLATVVAAALMYGTTSRDFDTIHEMLEGLGADMDCNAGIHTAGFGSKSLAEDLPTLLDLLQDTLRHPTFPDEHLDRLRGQYVTALQIREHDTRYRAGKAFRTLAYPAVHPYSRGAEATLDSLPSLTREKLLAFHKQHYGPRGMIVAVVGAIQAEAAIAAVEAAFGDWQNPAQAAIPTLPEAPALTTVRREIVPVEGKTQADIVLGVPGPWRQSPDFHAARLVNSILGQFGMYGRLGASVREAQGLAYYSYSSVEGEAGPGPWRVSAGVDPANVNQAIDSILAEIGRITREPVTAEELADNRSYFTGRIPLQLENNEGVAAAMLRMERYDLGLDYLWRYADTINALTADDLLATAQHYWQPDAYALAIAGEGLDG